ncbi:hypothetical protein Kfla_6275 [Kribbella flavida DSM 17836]|uniref:Uncharacterized protein n=1 Tax=Kribbella flavida (strain DSM 17836 / JCM 10339 / NBRC 14399) TaxID=479435 RepID=D2PVN8_KRIFD|nr:hypothetical protein [Kribbella flavida]ADB35278.1 hypothetical protein Kfla_6275 [Kribbella flavida DSM 17836]
MNLTDLRDELSQRAGTVETPDLLPGVRRRIRTTRRRRVAGSVTALAAVVALGIALAPGLTTTGPEPADSTPPDYVKDSVRISGTLGADRLDKAWVGNLGETRGSFSWTPTTQNIAVYAYCAAPGTARYAVQIGGRNAATGACGGAGSDPYNGALFRPDSPLWLDVPLNQPTTVTVQLTDDDGRVIEASSAQLGVGLYRAAKRNLPGATQATPTPGPGDREQNGLRFRGTVGGDTLLAAAGGKPGVNQLSGSFSATGRPIAVHEFCTANDSVPDFRYDLRVLVDGVTRISSCTAFSTDLGKVPGGSIGGVGTPGETVAVTVTLVDKAGREVTVPGARIGFAVYEKGPQRVYDDVAVDERTEYLGTTYELAEIKAVDAAGTREVSLRTPADTPFLVTYGSSALGGTGVVSGLLDGLSSQAMLSTDHGGVVSPRWDMSTDGHWPGPRTTLTLKITRGSPTKGKLILGIYTPVK